MSNPFSVAHKYLEQKLEATPESEPERPGPESLAAKILAEIEPSEAERIVTAWRDLLGVTLDPGKVREHLEAMRNWQSKWQRIRS